MKIAYFELMVELENQLEKQLISTHGTHYSLLLNPSGNSLTLLENGEIDYHGIEIYISGEKYTTNQNADKFWSIINKLEEEKKINDVFSDLEEQMRVTSPHLFEAELDFPKKIRTLSEFIVPTIFITGVGLLLFSLKFF